MSTTFEEQLKSATALTNDAERVIALRAVVFTESASDAETIKIKEQALSQLCDQLVKNQDAAGLAALLSHLGEFFKSIPKAKTAKLVRSLIDSIAKIPGSTALQVAVCKEQVEFAKAEKRTFLRQRIELRLASLYLDTQDFQAALALIGTLLSEVKKLDDKLLLVDIHLLESKGALEVVLCGDFTVLMATSSKIGLAVHHLLRNLPKARAALTAARTAANSIYVPVQLQGEIDTQSGILHAEEKDYKTGYSYFFEAFEQFSSLDDPRAVSVLKYMLLCKIMLSKADDVPGIISSKAGLKYTGLDVDAIRAVAKAYQDRSLQTFQDVLVQYKVQLVDDPISHTHLTALYDTLLAQNLVRLIEPFSRVEISHIATLIGLPVRLVEDKLSQMILDKTFAGTLDQGAGCLEVFELPTVDAVYPATLDIVESMGRVVDTLFARSQKVMA